MTYQKFGIKPKLALIFGISFLCIDYLLLVLYSIAWLQFGWAAYIANYVKQHYIGNILQLVEFALLFFIVYILITMVVSVLKYFLYWVTGLRKGIVASFKLDLHKVIDLIPIHRKTKKTTPLREYDRALYDRLIGWTRIHGNDIEDIQVLHAKNYSQETNAFFLGVGRLSKVILVDTLFDLYTRSEIEAIVAHEYGHKHDFISTWSVALVRLTGAALIAGWGIWHVITTGAIESISIFFLLVVLYWLFSMVLNNWISKYRELFADTYAVLHISDGDDFKSAAKTGVREFRDNLSAWNNRIPFLFPPFYC